MTQSILSGDFTVLGEECEYQCEDRADYKAYCSDGKIRYYSVSAYSLDPRDGARYSGYSEELPTWTTRSGESLTPQQMSPSHKHNVLKILMQRLVNATEAMDKARLACYIAAFSCP